MDQIKLTTREERMIDAIVQHYVDNRSIFDRLVDTLRVNITQYEPLFKHVHSIKWRVKDPDHLRDKLILKLKRAKRDGTGFDIDRDNLFTKINDLAGFRILHLYTRQIADINQALIDYFDEQRYRLLEGPSARTWDNESRDYFKGLGFETVDSETMYTSVHYVIEANTRTSSTCEIQVRTLAEELWGEVDHSLNYPIKSDIPACVEQIKVLARVTSSCTRLVDSIFTTHSSSQPQTASRKGRKKPLHRRGSNTS